MGYNIQKIEDDAMVQMGLEVANFLIHLVITSTVNYHKYSIETPNKNF